MEGSISETWVVDTSFTSRLILSENDYKDVQGFFEGLFMNRQTAIVPKLWVYESGNVLLSALKRKRINLTQISEALKLLDFLPINVIDYLPKSSDLNLIRFSERFHLSYYDTVYLDLAQKRGLSLTSYDDDLNNATKELSVQTFL